MSSRRANSFGYQLNRTCQVDISRLQGANLGIITTVTKEERHALPVCVTDVIFNCDAMYGLSDPAAISQQRSYS